MTYVKDSVIYTGLAAGNILVESESDLDLLTGYVPGTMAHTAGWTNVWELGTDGTWVPLVE